MDKESLRVCHEFDKLIKSGKENADWYFSDMVRSQAERIQELGSEEQLTIFSELFRANLLLITRLAPQDDYKYDHKSETLDMSEFGEGLGRISIKAYNSYAGYTEDEMELDCIEGRPIGGRPVAIRAVSEGYYSRLRGEIDYSEAIHAYEMPDNTFLPEDMGEFDRDILRLLDAKETLETLFEYRPRPAALRELSSLALIDVDQDLVSY